MVIGIDFDNTIVCYDKLLHEIACDRGLIPPYASRSKTAIRDAVRLLLDGEVKWQELQAEIYGPRMDGAELIPGVCEFLRKCKEGNVAAHIVSHKTEFANYDKTDTNLRDAASAWLQARGFFAGGDWGLPLEHVHFCSTRELKARKVAELGCSVFIDDLVEFFEELFFPGGVDKILFAPHGPAAASPAVGTVARTWDEIRHLIFHE